MNGHAQRTSRPVIWIGGFVLAKLALQLVALEPYGWFRHELYSVACANHLALGTSIILHSPSLCSPLWRAVVGDSLFAMRLIPMFAGAARVGVTGRIALVLGGGVAGVSRRAVCSRVRGVSPDGVCQSIFEGSGPCV
jgi:hypothetical protein